MKRRLFLGLLSTMLIFACSTEKKENMNPFFTEWKTPFKAVPFDQIQPEHFMPAIDSALALAKEEVDAVINNTDAPTFENTILALENSGAKLNQVASVLFALNGSETNDEIQRVVQEVSPKLTQFSNYVSLNDTLFHKVKEVYNTTDRSNLTQEQLTLLDKSYKNFIRNGADLQPEAKGRYEEITTELSKLSVQFQQNSLAETNNTSIHIADSTRLSGIPEGTIQAAAEEAKSHEKDGYIFTIFYPVYRDVMTYADDRDLRKEMFVAYRSKGNNDNEFNNADIVKQIVNLRLELAQLLGFDSYAAYVLERRMAETPDRVNSFMDQLLEAALPKAKQEVAEVEEFAHRSGLVGPLQRWDWSYYSEKLKKEKFNVNEEMVKPYFAVDNVVNGMLDLAKSLYGISFKERKDIPVYHPDVKVFEVLDENNDYLALLYMDFYPRKGKRSGAWATSFVDQHIADGKDVRPHSQIVFNFPAPTADKPSLLSYDDVHTALHEFGHSLHAMLSQVTYSSLSGTSVYWDFVELPSQIMENWTEQKEWLQKIAHHYQTGDPMPEDILNNLLNARNFNAGNFYTGQLAFGLTDMGWHSLTTPYNGSIEELEKVASGQAMLLPDVEGVVFSTSFGHLFSGGYAAGYYGYAWAEVLDKDAFSLFLENGIFDTKTAASFRENILSKGGTEHPMELYIRFRGKEPSIDALLESAGLI